MIDLDLLEGLKAGHGIPQYEAAARYIIATYAPKVMGYVMKNSGTKDDGKDHFNDVFIEVIKLMGEGKYEERGSFGGFFMTITQRRWLDKLRKIKRIKEGEMTDDISDDRETDNFILTDDLLPIWEKWEDRHKEYLKLFYGDGIAHKELGELYGISENTMKQRVNRCKDRFKEFVAQNME
jgi:RNA polymerase sigma factor (sigma-70 family)